MSTRKRPRVKESKKKLKGLPENKRNKVWSEEEMNIYARVLSNTDGKERCWLFQLENYALKKHANEELFIQIREEFEEAMPQDSAEYKFTTEQLRAKFKWFKKEWRRIDNKIKSGTGLGRKDTAIPTWYDILNPHFCEAFDDMTSVSSKASDLDTFGNSSEDKDDVDVDDDACMSANTSENSFEASDELQTSTSVCHLSADSCGEESIASSSVRNASVEEREESEKIEKRKDVIEVKRQIKRKSPRKTNVKFHPKRNSKPKSQSEAMIQVAKSIENSSSQQEKNKDTRFQALLESDRKRDEMFLAYQREQAEANRKHEMLMAQLLLQRTPSTNMQHGNYGHPFVQNMPLSSAISSWNTPTSTNDPQAESYVYHQL